MTDLLAVAGEHFEIESFTAVKIDFDGDGHFQSLLLRVVTGRRYSRRSQTPKAPRAHVSVSLDGYMAGPDQSVDNPLGVGGTSLHEWAFATHSGRAMHGMDGGDTGVDDGFIARGDIGIGATIMGRNMFGPVRGPWGASDWTGWWGDTPPYHHPVFVLTHRSKPKSITMNGGTTFHFVTDGIESALEQAFAAAGGGDVRIGGGLRRSAVTSAGIDRRVATWRSFRCSSAAVSAPLRSTSPRWPGAPALDDYRCAEARQLTRRRPRPFVRGGAGKRKRGEAKPANAGADRFDPPGTRR